MTSYNSLHNEVWKILGTFPKHFKLFRSDVAGKVMALTPLEVQSKKHQQTTGNVAPALPIVVVLVDDRDGPRVQVDPEEVRPHLHAALQPVALLYSSQVAVHCIHTQ